MDRLESLRAVFSRLTLFSAAFSLIAVTSAPPLAAADQAQADPASKSDENATEESSEKKSVPFPDPPVPGLKRLSPKADVWIDLPNKQLVLGAEVVLRRGPLELLACLKHTKEHEAVFAIETKAYIVHAGLLAIGATVGNPAKFLPEYTPARGTEVEVIVEWTDAAGKKQKKDGRQFIKNAKTGEAMTFPWVFGGSGFWVDPADNSKHYQAEDGDLICISNFPSAMLDVPVESSNANASLLFEAFTDNIPPEKTKVLIYLKPKLAKPAAGDKPEEKPAAPKSNSVSAATVSPAKSQATPDATVKAPAATVAAPVEARVAAGPEPSPAAASVAQSEATPAESDSAPAPSPESTRSSHKTDQTPRIGRWLRRSASYRRSL